MSDSNDFRSRVKNITNDRTSRVLLLGAGALVLGGLVFAFAPGVVTNNPSNLPAAPPGTSAQGGVKNSQAYNNAVVVGNDDRAKAADGVNVGLSGNGTNLPTPVFNPINDRATSQLGDRDEHAAEPPRPSAPVPVLSLPTNEPVRTETPRPVVQPQPLGPPPLDPSVKALMQAQMRAIVNTQIKPSETVYLYHPQDNRNSVTASQGGDSGNGNVNGNGSNSGNSASAGNIQSAGNRNVRQSGVNQAGQTSFSRPSRFEAPAPGTILYSRLIGQVNSDVPGPVIAEISQGPLSGSRLLGNFQFTEQGVIIQFSSMTVPFTDDGLERTEVVNIRSVAVDPQNLGTAMSTSIDRRIFERIAFGFATSFIQGLGQAITQSGSSTTLSPVGVTYGLRNLNTTDQLLAAGGNAAGVAGKILDQTYGNRRTTIVVEAGTPFGLLFLGNGSGSAGTGQ